MKYFALLFSLLISVAVQAQTIRPINVVTYDQELFTDALTDTLTNTDGAVYLWRNYTNFPHQLNWLMVNDELTGTGTVTVKLQESPLLDPSTSTTSADWYTRATYTITTDTTILVNFDMTFGRRTRLVVTTSGTGTNIFTPKFTVKRQETSYGN